MNAHTNILRSEKWDKAALKLETVCVTSREIFQVINPLKQSDKASRGLKYFGVFCVFDTHKWKYWFYLNKG